MRFFSPNGPWFRPFGIRSAHRALFSRSGRRIRGRSAGRSRRPRPACGPLPLGHPPSSCREQRPAPAELPALSLVRTATAGPVPTALPQPPPAASPAAPPGTGPVHHADNGLTAARLDNARYPVADQLFPQLVVRAGECGARVPACPPIRGPFGAQAGRRCYGRSAVGTDVQVTCGMDSGKQFGDGR